MMHRRMQQSDAKPIRSMTFSIVLHSFIVLIMVGTVSFMPKPTMTFANPNQTINAVFIDAQAIVDRQNEQKRAQELATQKRQQELAEQRERERQRQRQQQLEEQEREKQRQVALEAQKKREEEVAQEQERQRLSAEQQAREQELLLAQEIERERREEFERQLAEQLSQEQQALNAANRGRIMSEVEKYQALVHQTIVQNLFDLESFIGDTCRLNVRLAPSGLVIDVRVLDGDEALCRASQAAVLRPDTLPVSDDAEVFAQFKDFNITVIPEME